MIEINSVRDHIHILFAQSKNHAPSKIVAEVKTGSSGWIKTQNRRYADFAWQTGYGEFSVSPMHVKVVREYIRAKLNITGLMIFKPSIAGFAKKIANPWMNDTRGIETERKNCGVFVRPLQGRDLFFIRFPGVALGAPPQAITLPAFSPAQEYEPEELPHRVLRQLINWFLRIDWLGRTKLGW